MTIPEAPTCRFLYRQDTPSDLSYRTPKSVGNGRRVGPISGKTTLLVPGPFASYGGGPSASTKTEADGSSREVSKSPLGVKVVSNLPPGRGTGLVLSPISEACSVVSY